MDAPTVMTIAARERVRIRQIRSDPKTGGSSDRAVEATDDGWPIQLTRARAADRLRESLAGRADDAPIDRGIQRGPRRTRRQRIVGLVFDHRPDRDAERGQRVFERYELREQIRLDPRA